MRLQIQDPENSLDRDFGFWLINRIKQHFNAELDPRKLVAWDRFFDESDEFVSVYGTKISSQYLLRAAASNLILRKLPDSLEIFVNKNLFAPGLDRVKLDTVCRLITFGNQSVKGYPVLLNTFQYFVDNINYYIDLYDEGVE